MIYEKLERKFLLLDTNVLIYYANYPRLFEDMLIKIRNANVVLVLDDLVKFEFLRGAVSPEEEEDLRDFLQLLFGLTIEELEKPQFLLTSEIIRYATEIANLYSSKLKNAKISLTDCFLAGQLRKYNQGAERLYLATADSTDFPSLIFERIGIETVDAGEKIINIGFYRFDSARFQEAQTAYGR